MPAIPESLGDFKILRRIGAGGMAEVFVAEKQGAAGTSKRLVVKRILPGLASDAALHALFVREAQLATSLDHPNVVHVHELFDHPEDGLLLSMEFVDGADLASVLRAVKRRGARVPPYVAALIAREAAKGLHYAHERAGADGAPLEIVHRDVSPQNILLSREGAVKVADLGVATARLFRDATTGVKGKLRYMAPEQADGVPLDRRADVYALGVVLYEALRLASPYGARTDAALMRAVREGRFDPPLAEITQVPADLLAVLRRALARDRADRYPTARALADDLSQALMAQRRVIDEAAIEALVREAIEAPEEPGPLLETATATTTVAAGPVGQRRAHAPPSRVLTPGARIGRYVIQELLGRGGMADVYAARDTTLDRQVALKILRGETSDDTRRQLLREAKLAARFEHPGSVVVYDVGEAAEVGFIAMELVRGVLLSELVGDADVPLARRARWMVSAARVLAAAHATGLVHRDVKPTNLMIREGGEVKILDFGVARATAAPSRPGEPSSSGGSFVGTLRYAAPERFAGGPVDGRADQFSWGVTAWELFAGRHPFEDGDALDAVGKMLGAGIGALGEAAPATPAEIAEVVDRAVAMRPEDRFATLDDAADALEPFAEAPPARPTQRSIPDADPAPPLPPSLPPPPAAAPPLTPPPPATPPRASPSPLRRAAILAVAAAFAAAVGLGLARERRPAAAARGSTGLLLGDPRGSLALVASYFQEGRFEEALRALREHAARARDQGDAEAVMKLSLTALRVSRWLGRAPHPQHVSLLEQILADPGGVPAQQRVQIQAELALAGHGESVTATLARVEADAARDADDPLARDRALVSALPLARSARGDRAASLLWAQAAHAPYAARRASALDAALALEATGDAQGAEAAYVMAADPVNDVEDSAERVLALARLALLYRREGRDADAAALSAKLEALWSSADPGLVKAVASMR